MSKICGRSRPGDGAQPTTDARLHPANIASNDLAGTCAIGGDVARSASGYDSVVDPLLGSAA